MNRSRWGDDIFSKIHIELLNGKIKAQLSHIDAIWYTGKEWDVQETILITYRIGMKLGFHYVYF